MLSFLFFPATTTTTAYHPLHLSSNHRVFDFLPVSVLRPSVRLSVCWSRKATMRRVSGRRGTSASGLRSTTAPLHRLSTETTITTVSTPPVCSLEPRAGCVTSYSLLSRGPSPNVHGQFGRLGIPHLENIHWKICKKIIPLKVPSFPTDQTLGGNFWQNIMFRPWYHFDLVGESS